MSEPSDEEALLDVLFREPASDVAEDYPVSAKAVAQVDETRQRLGLAQVVQVEQANKLRDPFFWFGVGAASLCVGASIEFVLLSQIFGQRLSDAVAVAFISGLSVQAIGITKIMAGYLFPSHKTETSAH